MKRLIILLALCGVLCLGINVSQATQPLPPEIINSSTAMVLYHSGYIEVEDLLRTTPPDARTLSLRGMANVARTQALLFARNSVLFTAFLLGRADAFDAAADAAGEP